MALKNSDYEAINFGSTGGSAMDNRGWTPEKVKEALEEVEEEGEIRFNSDDLNSFLGKENSSQGVSYRLWGLRQIAHISNAVNRSNMKKENKQEILLNQYGLKMDNLLDKVRTFTAVTKRAPNGEKIGIIKKSKQLNFQHRKPSSYDACACSDFETKKSRHYAPDNYDK